MFFKVFFFIYCVLIASSPFVPNALESYEWPQWISHALSFISMVGVFSYAFRKRILQRAHWVGVAVVYVVYELLYYLWLGKPYIEGISSNVWLSYIVAILLDIPIVFALIKLPVTWESHFTGPQPQRDGTNRSAQRAFFLGIAAGTLVPALMVGLLYVGVTNKLIDTKIRIHENSERLSIDDLIKMSGTFFWDRTIGPDIIRKFDTAEIGLYTKGQGCIPLFSKGIDYVDDTTKARILVSVQKVNERQLKIFMMSQVKNASRLGDTIIDNPFTTSAPWYLGQGKFWKDDTITAIALYGNAHPVISKILEDPANEKVIYIRFHNASGAQRVKESSQHFKVRLADTLPSLSYFTLGGESEKFKPSQSRLTLLSFAQTSCCPCIDEITKIRSTLLPKYARKGLSACIIVSKDRDESVQSVEKFRQTHAKGLSVYYDTAAINLRQIASRVAFPTTMLVDSEGKILYQHTGYTKKEFLHLTQTVKEYLSGM